MAHPRRIGMALFLLLVLLSVEAVLLVGSLTGRWSMEVSPASYVATLCLAVGLIPALRRYHGKPLESSAGTASAQEGGLGRVAVDVLPSAGGTILGVVLLLLTSNYLALVIAPATSIMAARILQRSGRLRAGSIYQRDSGVVLAGIAVLSTLIPIALLVGRR